MASSSGKHASRFTLHASRGETVAFRVDGNSSIGTGHLARCALLARELQGRGKKVVWITAGREGARYAPRGAKVLRPARGWGGAGAVVLDGYHFDERLEKQLRARGLKVATLDDNAERRFCSDWVLNGNVHARGLRYRAAAHTRCALGPKYFLFSVEMVRARRRRKFARTARRVLVTMGGADPANVTEKVLRALARLKEPVEVTAVAGPTNPRHGRLSRLARRLPYRCRVLRSSDRMGVLMAGADLGISSAGRVAAEMALHGLPGIKIILADNQAAIARVLHQRGAGINLGRASRLNEVRIARALRRLIGNVALRRKMSDNARRIFDGKGTKRVTQILEKLTQ